MAADLRSGGRGLLLLLSLLCLSGCLRRVYYHVTEPLDVNFHETPVVDGYFAHAASDTKQFRYYTLMVIPVMQLQWDSNAIQEIAHEHGMEKVFYADLETLDILGTWTRRWVHLYGRASQELRDWPENGGTLRSTTRS